MKDLDGNFIFRQVALINIRKSTNKEVGQWFGILNSDRDKHGFPVKFLQGSGRSRDLINELVLK